MIKIRLLYGVIFILSVVVHVACKKADNDNLNPATVLIFDNIPTYVRTTHPFPRFTSQDGRFQITIFDHFYEYNFNPKPLLSDTIILLPRNDRIILTFLYSKTCEPLNYVIDKGDTITFSFISGVPYAKSKEVSKDRYLNYDYDRLIATQNAQQARSYQIYRHPILVAKNLDELINNRSQIKKEYYISARNFLHAELLFLNNLKEFRNKSPDIFNFFKDKSTYQIAELDFEQHKLGVDSLNAILSRNKKNPENSSYSYFFPFLEKVADSVIVKKAKFLTYENGSGIDYRDVYDRTMNWSVINDFYKKHLLYKYLKKIGDIFSMSDLQLYLSKFAEFSNDTLLVRNIKNEFLIYDHSASWSKDSLYMIDPKGNSLSLQQLLNVNRGKIIYIDFWASWCVPCRREMKYAEKFRKTFKSKKVVFVYLSLDKSKNAWIEASKEEGLYRLANNYILTNADSSTFLQSINFVSIPRYLLYDKYGKLVIETLPRPVREKLSVY